MVAVAALFPAHALATFILVVGHRGWPPCTGQFDVVRMFGGAAVLIAPLLMSIELQYETAFMEDVM